MIRHIVIIQFREDRRDYLALMKKTIPIVKQIPGIISYELFENQSKYVPQNMTSVGVELKFKDQKALEYFMAHPRRCCFNQILRRLFLKSINFFNFGIEEIYSRHVNETQFRLFDSDIFCC